MPWYFPTNRIAVTISATGWNTIDLSGVIDGDPTLTAAQFEIENKDSNTRAALLRPYGSSDSFEASGGDIIQTAHKYQILPVYDQKIDGYFSSSISYYNLYLTAYCTDSFGYGRTDAADVTPPGSSYSDVDISAYVSGYKEFGYGIARNASGSSGETHGITAPTSLWPTFNVTGNISHLYNGMGVCLPCVSGTYRGKRESTNAAISLYGALSPFWRVWNTSPAADPANLSPVSADTGWLEIDLSSLVSPNATAAIVRISNANAVQRQVTVRHGDSTEETQTYADIRGVSLHYLDALVGLSASKKIGFYRELSTDTRLYCLGYYSEVLSELDPGFLENLLGLGSKFNIEMEIEN